MTVISRVTLYYRAGTSDKVYQASIEAQGSGFVVNFAYGRRGDTLKAGTKTQTPVSQAEAEKIYNKLIAEKRAKGYTEGEDGTPYVGGNQETRVTGVAPQLLVPIDEEAAASLLTSAEFGMQEKFNGRRMMIRWDGALAEAINRSGLTCGFPKIVADECGLQRSSFLIDGEALDDRFVAFDILSSGGTKGRIATDWQPYSYRARYRHLSERFGKGTSITVAPLAVDECDKAVLYKELQAENREGAVFKRLDARYTPGRSHTDQFKLKFWATATCLVEAINSQRSVKLAMAEPFTIVGNCTIPPNKDLPKKHALIEVKYLYAHKGGSLVQPTFLSVRDDKDTADRVDSLKFKPE